MTATDDTGLGGEGSRFPITHRSAILAACSDDPSVRARAFDAIVTAYWKPVYKYVRIKWSKSNEDAKDLTQGFFARAIEKSFFDGYDHTKARFRTFLRVCLDGFIANEEKASHRIKRGGAATLLPLDFEGAEGEMSAAALASADSPDDFFEKEWIRSLFSIAVESLRDECRSSGKLTHFRLFERYYIDDSDEERPSYQQLAAEFDLSTSNVTNYLAAARREFRRIVLETLRGLTSTEEEFHREARALLGVDAK